jgi:hypothetical protein
VPTLTSLMEPSCMMRFCGSIKYDLEYADWTFRRRFANPFKTAKALSLSSHPHLRPWQSPGKCSTSSYCLHIKGLVSNNREYRPFSGQSCQRTPMLPLRLFARIRVEKNAAFLMRRYTCDRVLQVSYCIL